LNVSLAPTTNAVKAAYYTVRFYSDGAAKSMEYWSVPQSAAPVSLRDVRTHAIASAPPSNLTSIAVQDVSGLRTELDLRPIRGASFVTGRAAVIGASGGIEAVIGDPANCVRVDGTAGPCGVGGGSFVDAETPAGATDGVNTVFQTSVAPNPAGSLLLFHNGVLQRQGAEYTLAGRNITFTVGYAPRQGDVLTAWYRSAPDSTYVFADPETPAGAVNGTNANFTLSGAPLPASSLMLYRNGLLQKAGVDYTLSQAQITFLAGAIPQSGDLLQATYRK
jgi:hypothetical protein